MEISAIELQTKSSKFIILSLCRAPTRDFNQFIKNLDNVLKYLYKPKVEFLICGDINTYYLIKKKLASLLTHNMSITIFQQEFKITQVLPLITYLWITVE